MPDKRHDPTYEEIARRAYEISQSSEAGTEEENWHRAERELTTGPDDLSDSLQSQLPQKEELLMFPWVVMHGRGVMVGGRRG